MRTGFVVVDPPRSDHLPGLRGSDSADAPEHTKKESPAHCGSRGRREDIENAGCGESSKNPRGKQPGEDPHEKVETLPRPAADKFERSVKTRRGHAAEGMKNKAKERLGGIHRRDGNKSTNLHHVHAEEPGQLGQLRGQMPHTHGAMVGRALHVPGLNESAPTRKTCSSC